jgi:3'-phosphoadenosine 5'-phosphosulfate (PAPS) 3'-phosphatase
MLRIDANRMEHLLKSTLTAVQQLRTVLQAMYDKNAAQQAVLKSDGSVFTIADGIVQNILSKSFASVGMKVVGEEDALVDLRQTPFTVNGLTVASELNSAIEDSQRQIDAVFRQLGSCALTQSLTVFIDPIDGTREFNSARGEQCSINVGFALNRASIAGVIYRPINDAGWAMGAPECGLRESSFAASRARRDAGAGCRLVTTNGRMSPFLVAVQSELGAERVAAGAVGNKVLMLIEVCFLFVGCVKELYRVEATLTYRTGECIAGIRVLQKLY